MSTDVMDDGDDGLVESRPRQESRPVRRRKKKDGILHSLISGEATGFTLAVMLGIFFWLIIWRPIEPLHVGIAWFLALMVAAWYSNAQQGALVESTSEKNLGNDARPVQGMFLSILPDIIVLVAVVLHFVAMNMDPSDSMRHRLTMDLSEWGVAVATVTFTFGDLKHNTLMLVRTLRLTPEQRIVRREESE